MFEPTKPRPANQPVGISAETPDHGEHHATFDRLLDLAVAPSESRGERDSFTGTALLAPGTLIADRYVTERMLGAGGMGVVFAGRDRKMGGKPIALKWLRSDPARSSATRRFLREAVAAGPIVHRNVVSIYDFGFHGERPYLVMELLQGEPLSARVARGPFDVAETLRIAIGTLRGIAAVHARGIVHRDLKPDNVFLCTDPEQGLVLPKVLDFGIAKLNPEDFGRVTATEPGLRLGTPHYMAPEVIREQAVDPRTDIYSISVMLYLMLTGRHPFEGGTEYDLYRRVLQSKFTRPRALRPELSGALEAIVLKGMSLEPAQRFCDATTMAEALESVRSTRIQLRSLLVRGTRPIAALTLAFALLCTLVAWLLFFTNTEAPQAPPPLPIVPTSR